MSASYLVDANGTLSQFELNTGNFYTASALIISKIADMINVDSFTNLYIAGQSQFTSGEMRIQVQTADDTNSGSFTDPTSGLAQFPTVFQSGGIVYLNSGGGTTAAAPAASYQQGGVFNAFASGACVTSGFLAFAGFQRPGRYARTITQSGGFMYLVGSIGFLGQNKTTGSGGGFSLAPGSGSVSV